MPTRTASTCAKSVASITSGLDIRVGEPFGKPNHAFPNCSNSDSAGTNLVARNCGNNESPDMMHDAARGFGKPGFGHIETWVFDLDNTLYPHHLNLWQQVDERIRAYIADFLKVGHDEAFRVQKDYYKR